MFKQVILLTCVVWVWGSAFIGAARAADPSLVDWWKLDETSGTTAHDSAGGSDGVLYGGPVWQPSQGRMGGALQFNGANAYVRAAHIPLSNRSFTIAMWVNPALLSGEQTIFSQVQENSGNLALHLRLGGPGAVCAPIGGLRMGFYSNDLDSPPGIIQNNTWHHLTFCYDFGSRIRRIYVNGEQVAQDTGVAPFAATTGYTVMGSHNAVDQWFNGILDDVRVYSRALTRDAIVQVTFGVEDVSLAWNPTPVDGSTVDVDEAAVLSWSPGDNAVWHGVYFGVDRGKVEQAGIRTAEIYRGRQTPTAYDLSGELAMNQVYYWRIDEVDKANAVHKGTIWSFTTAGFVLVDDFEKYTDVIGGCIFETWIDGMGYIKPAPGNPGNGTGSVVGNANPPYAEATIVHSGKQSMPLGYDNSQSPFYSEAERTFNPPKDWTRLDVNALTLYVRGDRGNEPTTVYVQIEDSARHSKLVSYADRQAVTKGNWRQWDIPFGVFAAGSVDLKSIEKIVIGIGDRTAAKAGGKGKVYVDDIRLTKSGGGALRPVAYWEFEEGSGSQAADSAGLNDGTVIGATWLPGKIGKALSFDGFDDYVDCGSDGALNPVELTVALWVCPENVYVMAQSLVAKVGSESSDVDYSLQIGMMGAVKGLFRAGDSNVVVSGARNLVAGEWTHLALTRDGSEMALYVDGGSRTSVGYSVPPVNGGYPLRIGGPRAYQGKIDDVRIYDQALAPEQIEQIAGGQM